MNTLKIIAASKSIEIVVRRLLAEHDVTVSQFEVMTAIRSESKPILTIAKELSNAVPGITGLIDRLEKAEFVTRERSKKDRRVVSISLTKSGEAKLKAAEKTMAEFEKRINKLVAATDMDNVVDCLTEIKTELANTEQ